MWGSIVMGGRVADDQMHDFFISSQNSIEVKRYNFDEVTKNIIA